jgi:beta-galactosidase
VPSLYLVTDDAVVNIERFVRGGGVLLMTFFSGIVDEFEHIRLGGYPKPFADMLGVGVTDFYPLASGEEVGLRFGDGTVGQGSVWSEEIELHGAEAIATFGEGVGAGRPAITRNRFGDGTAIYVGTLPDPAALARVLKSACTTAGVAENGAMPRGVEVVRRAGKGKSILFLLNHRDVVVDVPVEEAGQNLVDRAEVHRGLIRLQPRGVAVIEEGW